MASLSPRSPYSQDELNRLYPKGLELQLVQVLLRHGERSPTAPRFQNTGLQPHWPYCSAARQLTSAIMITKDFSKWEKLEYQRRIETFGKDDSPVIVTNSQGESDSICQSGELTNTGRQTTLSLGQRLRHLYVDQLAFMPKLLTKGGMIYLRATPIPRALESVQQTFWGFYPPSMRVSGLPPPAIITRNPADETLYPNNANCRRLAQLSQAFAQRAALKWNDSDDLKYLNKLYSKWMPGQARVAVDSKPRLSGIMDTINSTDAHGPETKLPKEFYDPKARAIIDQVCVEEWYSGYAESEEYRMLGIGSLMGDITSRMIESVAKNSANWPVRGQRDETNLKFALSGCHDTTLASVLTSLGAFDNENWPPYSSHVAFELFRQQSPLDPSHLVTSLSQQPSTKSQGWRWFPFFRETKSPGREDSGITRSPLSETTTAQRDDMKNYYVRIRYNDHIMQVRGCKDLGKHLDGDTTMCTLEAFKSIVDKYTPRDWKAACLSRLNEPALPEKTEPAGYLNARNPDPDSNFLRME